MTKKYSCVEVMNHIDIPQVIHEHLKQGWRLHTYTTAGTNKVQHFLLFEKG